MRRLYSGIADIIVRKPLSLAADRRGNIAIITALVMPVFVGALGLGMEPGYWYLVARAEQNAADAAVIAASTNGSSNYATEGQAVAAQYGFVNGQNNVTVTVSNSASCPAGGTNCYSVTITKPLPLFLSQVVGFHGDVTVSGTRMKKVRASAISTQSVAPISYCLLALASSGAEGIRTNGAPFADMSNCNVMSDTTATCNGHNLNAAIGNAHGANNGCGITENSNVAVVTDPYSGLASNIPTNTCASYPQEPAKKKDPALPASNTWSGSKSLSGNTIICGDLQLTGDVTVNAASGAVLVIENGQLDTNGYKLQTPSGSALTVVFSGTSASGYTHAPTGGGTLDFAAPTSGPWKGVAIYQDPALTSGMDISAAGNSPTWDITGLVYLPHSSVTFSGAVNKSSNGQSCFGLVVDNITINGTGSILSTGGCAAAGLALPTGTSPARGKLVG
ncbi:MAG TPA: pilus assembly protein TadG-related protein [Rhizomicrobium sp.]|nr:pilus assembly protein TadG-related protein [Rhizomicrobium sp.]